MDRDVRARFESGESNDEPRPRLASWWLDVDDRMVWQCHPEPIGGFEAILGCGRGVGPQLGSREGKPLEDVLRQHKRIELVGAIAGRDLLDCGLPGDGVPPGSAWRDRSQEDRTGGIPQPRP